MSFFTKKYYDRYWKWFGQKTNALYERDLVFEKVFSAGEKVLDVACGDGSSSKIIAQITHVPVYGLDVSAVAVKQAKINGVLAKVANVEKMFPLKGGVFDIVFWGDNIEHLFNPLFTLHEINRVLKPGGKLVLSTPNTGYWRYRFQYFITGKISDTEFNGKKAWEFSHIRFFDYDLLKEFLLKENFVIENCIGVNRRALDRFLVSLFPKLCGMILVVKARKTV